MSKKENNNQNSSKEDVVSPEIKQELSKVATNPKQSMIVMIIIALVLGYFVFNFVIGSTPQEDNMKKEKVPMPNEVARPTMELESDKIPRIPNLPEPPDFGSITPPPPPPPPVPEREPSQLPPVSEVIATPEVSEIPALPTKSKDNIGSNRETESGVVPLPNSRSSNVTLPSLSTFSSEERARREEAKIKSSIMLISGVPQKSSQNQTSAGDRSESIDGQKSSSSKRDSGTVKVKMQERGNMHLMLGRGKLIDAIIENAINTDFGGEIRGIISRDVYSEWGKNILIPKGSRIFGEYTTTFNSNYARVGIVWTRIDLVNGYSLTFDGESVDNLGRLGVHGRLDQKFKEKMTNAVLMSAFNIVTAKGLDLLVKPQATSQQATQNQNNVAAIRNSINTIFADSSIAVSTKITEICRVAKASITDTTSTAYSQVNISCQQIQDDTTSTPEAKLTRLISAINIAIDSMIVNLNQTASETQAQAASKQAYADLTDTVKEMLQTQNLQANVTLDQGSPIKIYINRDYEFPPDAVRIMKKFKNM